MVRRTDNSKAVKAAAHEIGGDALFEGAEFLLEESNRTVPHDEGDLEKSGSTDVDRRALVATVSYDTPYAVRQHEDMTLRHSWTTTELDEQGNVLGSRSSGGGRRAKWLELTVQEQAQAIERHIADRMKEAFR